MDWIWLSFQLNRQDRYFSSLKKRLMYIHTGIICVLSCCPQPGLLHTDAIKILDFPQGASSG